MAKFETNVKIRLMIWKIKVKTCIKTSEISSPLPEQILKLFILRQKAKQVQDMNQTLIDIMRVTGVNLTAQFPRGSKSGHLVGKSWPLFRLKQRGFSDSVTNRLKAWQSGLSVTIFARSYESLNGIKTKREDIRPTNNHLVFWFAKYCQIIKFW